MNSIELSVSMGDELLHVVSRHGTKSDELGWLGMKMLTVCGANLVKIANFAMLEKTSVRETLSAVFYV